MSNRSFVRVVITSLLGVVGLSLGCDKSPSAPTPPAVPVSVTAAAVPVAVSLTASPSLVASGGQLTVSWVAPTSRRGSGDWVALFRVGDPDSAATGPSYGWFGHFLDTSVTVTLTAPMQPGQYEFRYMVGDLSVSRSGAVTVTASASQ